MAHSINTGTRAISLEFARILSEKVNELWKSGEFMQKVSDTSAHLLEFWFNENEARNLNFHSGQRQAILNTIYCHEILKAKSMDEIYDEISPNLKNQNLFSAFSESKDTHPKYCIKMATGTGKTWVLNALLIWQYLNACENSKSEVKFSKNFLIVAPGLIVYERLVNSFLGQENSSNGREISTSDIYKNAELFLPKRYKERVLSFIQNATTKKEDIANSFKSEGIIAITNWHNLTQDEVDENSQSDNPKRIIDDLLPIKPGVAAGNSLDTLDGALKGGVLKFLANLENLCVFNDEAHHIHTTKSGGTVQEVEWQKSLNFLAQNKGRNFTQIDFSATPYNVSGSEQNRTKNYFPHIICDFGLKEAIYQGLVKMIAIDKRVEGGDLDFKAVRDEKSGEVISLSDGQKIMLQAGLKKLDNLEKEFSKFNKSPKMLIICEDTSVSPKVMEFLREQGLKDDEITQIDSDKKGEVSQKEWQSIKQKLFNIDKQSTPRVIVSVLMLREGFDVNNICVIVPLRSSGAPILLEQVIGRGSRLMWRESEFEDSKAESRELVLKQKKSPNNYFDILSIVEHPRYEQFYEDLDKELVFEDDGKNPKPTGDMIIVGLKENYEKYDIFIPKIINPKEEFLKPLSECEFKFEAYSSHSLAKLREIEKPSGEKFISEALIVKTRFGEYEVNSQIFNARSYNEFLAKMTDNINMAKRKKGTKSYPLMQVDNASLVQVLDDFIRTKLFKEKFDPIKEWRILTIKAVVEHIFKQINEFIIEAQNNIDVKSAEIQREYFSQVNSLKMREKFTINLTKSIYEKTAYPSNKGIFEREFMLFCDNDGSVDKIIKIEVKKHEFASIFYIKTNGQVARYYPDFIVQSGDKIYLIETKAQKDLDNKDVEQKKMSAIKFTEQINELDAKDRGDAIWSYHILDENTFISKKNGTLNNMLKACELNKNRFEGRLF